LVSREADLRILMLASLEGDARSHRTLLENLRPRLHGYFNRRLVHAPDDAEELVQECLIAIHDRRASYDRTQPLLPWVYAIARYKLIDHYRRNGRRATVPIEDHEAETSVMDQSAAVHARHDVERALALLPDRVRTLVEDHKLRELSMKETAARAGMTETAVKVAVHRGIKLMAVLLGNGRSSK
jgi:RNA polymerase sigma-70 factor (ECF subfamily)